MKNFSPAFRLLALASSGALLVGCSSLRTVNVLQDPSLSGASVGVDVIAVNDKNKVLETCSVRDYWSNGRALRGGAYVKTLRFGQGQASEQSVTEKWQSLGAKKVVVIADLPGVFPEGSGSGDPRRKVIPVTKAAVVTVRVTPSGLHVQASK